MRRLARPVATGPAQTHDSRRSAPAAMRRRSPLRPTSAWNRRSPDDCSTHTQGKIGTARGQALGRAGGVCRFRKLRIDNVMQRLRQAEYAHTIVAGTVVGSGTAELTTRLQCFIGIQTHDGLTDTGDSLKLRRLQMDRVICRHCCAGGHSAQHHPRCRRKR